MAKTLVIELSDQLEQQLTSEAKRLNTSLENVVLQALINLAAANQAESNPILPLLGSLNLKINDLGENHD
jgi:predicted transcriptional regulator